MTKSFITRFLTVDDIPALQRLEALQWDSYQAATDAALRFRIETHRHLCVGAFCADTGEALASLFMRPISGSDLKQAKSWSDCAGDFNRITPCKKSRTLFGISFTSVDPGAAESLFQFFWPYALKQGWRHIYLGSPMPGLKRALEQDPRLNADTYAHSRRGGAPRDRQLRYYHQKGFQEVVAVLPGYFPHASSLDYGILLRGHVPLSALAAVWSLMPIGTVRTVTSLLGRAQPIPALLRSKLARWRLSGATS